MDPVAPDVASNREAEGPAEVIAKDVAVVAVPYFWRSDPLRF